MITLVEARNPQGTLLSLPLGDISGGYSVQDIDGLDPVDATIVTSNYAGTDGEQYDSSSIGKRNIILKLGYETDYVTNSVKSLRKKLQRIFRNKKPVNLRFYDDDGTVVEIDGRVEYNRSPLFEQEPSAEISVLCFEPAFQSISSTTFSGNSVNGDVDTLVEYDGDENAGIVLTVNVNQTLTEFTVYNTGEDDIVKTLDIQASLVAGDVVTISTVPGSKYVKLTRSGLTSSLLYAMPPQSYWIDFTEGENRFRVYNTGTPMPYTVTYFERYGSL